MSRLEYKKDVAFINREKELTYLKQYLQERPESLLFVYGPKSSGKTTLLYRLLNQRGKEKRYEVKFLNLREILTGNYKDFIKTFFNVQDISDKKTKKKYEISAGIFKINRETEQKLLNIEADPFKVMKNELIAINRKNKQPLIVIDELQELQEIYVNGQRQLINELFNLFVAMTKETHLSHIIVSSSDGYFIERVYEDSRLRKTSKFYMIDYLTKGDVWEWLNNLEKHSKIKDMVLTEEQIEEIWNFLGGSCWEIQSLLSDIMNTDFKNAIAKYKKEKESDIVNCINKDLEREKILKLFADSKLLSKKKIFNMTNIEFNKLGDMLSELVRENILFFDPVEASFMPQGKSVEYGIKKIYA